jgi:hypothetical protein
VYGLPFNGTRKFQARIGLPARHWLSTHVGAPLSACWAPLHVMYRSVITCCGRCAPHEHSAKEDTIGLPPTSLAAGAATAEAITVSIETDVTARGPGPNDIEHYHCQRT